MYNIAADDFRLFADLYVRNDLIWDRSSHFPRHGGISGSVNVISTSEAGILLENLRGATNAF